MSRPRSVPQQVLNDYLASLRMADSLVREFGGPESASHDDGGALTPVLLRAYQELAGLHESVRRSRARLQRTPVERSQRSHGKLNEVTSAARTAASDVLDGLDRALALVDELDRDEPASAESAACDRLREELFRVISCVQFQDITSLQIGHASSVLEDFERRMQVLMAALNQSMPELRVEMAGATREIHGVDTAASPCDAGARQAVAVETFVQESD